MDTSGNTHNVDFDSMVIIAGPEEPVVSPKQSDIELSDNHVVEAVSVIEQQIERKPPEIFSRAEQIDQRTAEEQQQQPQYDLQQRQRPDLERQEVERLESQQYQIQQQQRPQRQQQQRPQRQQQQRPQRQQQQQQEQGIQQPYIQMQEDKDQFSRNTNGNSSLESEYKRKMRQASAVVTHNDGSKFIGRIKLIKKEDAGLPEPEEYEEKGELRKGVDCEIPDDVKERMQSLKRGVWKSLDDLDENR